MTFNVQKIADLDIVVQELIKYTKEHKVFCFFGKVGAGKTTLIAQFCKKLGITDEISSPTYSIIQEYALNNEKLYHIDLYRLNNEEEAYDIGLEDYLYSGSICLIEWPDDSLDMMPENYIKIEINNLDGIRKIIIN